MACINSVLSAGTIAAMHESMQRLFALAASGRKIPPVVGDSAVAKALNVSPQTVHNWTTRGLSKGGAIQAAAVFGGSASELLGVVVESKLTPKEGVDQPLIHLLTTLPSLVQWEVVMDKNKMPAVPDDFILEMPDGALEPKLMRGEQIWFKKASTARPKNVVLVEAAGKRWIRRYEEDVSGPRARATDEAFPSFTEFVVLAVMFMRPQDSI